MKKQFFNCRRYSGFTLIEMCIVIFIISLLLFLIIPNLGVQKQRASERTDVAFIETMQGEVDVYDGKLEGISWEKLETEHYISSRQAKKAQQMGLIIVDGQVKAQK